MEIFIEVAKFPHEDQHRSLLNVHRRLLVKSAQRLTEGGPGGFAAFGRQHVRTTGPEFFDDLCTEHVQLRIDQGVEEVVFHLFKDMEPLIRLLIFEEEGQTGCQHLQVFLL
mmetsp:Transcript_83388/g.102165  ORF Transcript_83388/g.102165 Transcript_83388/m.102165 type:complete len:111 (+) Transcript_83388:138-470(+)